MNIFYTLQNKLQAWNNSTSSLLNINGVSSSQWAFIFQNLVSAENSCLYNDKSNHLILTCQSLTKADEIFDILKSSELKNNIIFFPPIETSPYGEILSSEKTLFTRFSALFALSNRPSPKIIICTYDSLFSKIPPRSFFLENTFTINVSDIISPHDLAAKLGQHGYSHTASIEEPGSFTQKGEIFDLFTLNYGPIRIHYFDDMIEEIFAIDQETLKTQRDISFETIFVAPTPHILSNGKFTNSFRENIPVPSPAFRNKYEKRKNFLRHLADNILFPNYSSYVPLFFKQTETIIDYFTTENALLVHTDHSDSDQSLLEQVENYRVEYDEQKSNTDSQCIMPASDYFYCDRANSAIKNFKCISVNEISKNIQFEQDPISLIEMNLESTTSFFSHAINPTLKKPEYLKESFLLIKKQFAAGGEIIFSTTTDSSRKEIKYLMEMLHFPTDLMKRIHLIKNNIPHGFYYPGLRTILITEGDLFSIKRKKAKKVKKGNLDLFAEQISTLVAGDYVIHAENGVGKYLGMESLTIQNKQADFLIIEYTNSDKVYVPVYKMNLVQKHSNASSNQKVDSLRTTKFKLLKDKAKVSAKKLAFDLLRLQAERQSANAFAFSAPDHIYNDFELSFQFQETPDQSLAISDVLESMQKPVPMDHLVCGDVGFGKTEVAIRAAFKAVLDNKQVAVLVPTTILALQHFHTFTKRLKDFPVNIEFLSRFKSAKQTKEIKESLKQGKIDIVIGTHKLLSKDIKYLDLGLVVVDEEQRFGVTHKEKLKLLKTSVDFLTLTATPIPRTLQLAFLGIRDLSLIQTAPPSRQSIKSYVVRNDDKTIQDAIRKELARGGQVFIVHNKVNDIEIYASKIRALVPEGKILFAHGQMRENELESRMEDFYTGKFNILIATTIIESGLDIPNANTMIIDRADNYGLSQLHQLRGRIGRSDKKAYCYFIIPATGQLTPIAEKRLKALQTYADIGSGFHIASCDLEIRGAGDILGGEQSGHIDNVGLELYMELLKDAIHELKGEKQLLKTNLEILSPFSTLIPNSYIQDSSARLKNYKVLANSNSLEQIEKIKESLEDIYGLFPQELNNLFAIIEVRILLQNLAIKTLQIGGKNITIQFEKSLLESNFELRDKIVNYFVRNSGKYHLSPSFKVTFTHNQEVDTSFLVNFATEISKKIIPVS